MIRRNALVWIVAALTLAACGKKDTPPPAETKAPETAAPPAADDAKAPPAEADTAKAEEPAKNTPPPAEFTYKDSPQLADIPAHALKGKVLGAAFAEPKVEITYGPSDWSLKVEFKEGEHFTIPLKEAIEAPAVGYTLVKPKACCPGYLHRAEEGKRASSLNAPNGIALEITTWDVADWQDGKGMKQPGGAVAGRLAVTYDADNWVAGTFETELTYFGEPPAARAARLDKEKQASLAELEAYSGLAAPEGVAIAKGKKVWATAKSGESWKFGQWTVDAVEDGVVMLQNNAFTAPGLVRAMAPMADVKKGAIVAAVDHLGAQVARVVAVGDDGKIEVSYLNPVNKPRTNKIAADRVFPWATAPDAAGMPASVVFEGEGGPQLGQAVAVDGDQALVALEGGKGLVKKPAAELKAIAIDKPLKKGAKVWAHTGCGMNGYKLRAGKITAVVEGGIGYVVDADPCKGKTLSPRLVMKK